MSSSDGSAGRRDETAGFAERLLAVIDEGRRTATYKLALLVALTECCAEAGAAPGNRRLTLSTRTIAEGVARVYWRQLRPFQITDRVIQLRQITNKSAAVLSALTGLHNAVPLASSWESAYRAAPELAENVLDQVELTVARYPLLRLQVIDGVPQPFIYEIGWTERVTLRHLHGLGDGAVSFQIGAPDHLVRLAPLIRPLVETHWVRMVAELNGLTPVEDELRRHLFGTERSTFPPVLRRGLKELQSNVCFYCGISLDVERSAIDHFIPWARWPNDAIENLVTSHAACNGHKSDRIPGPVPLAHWSERMRSRKSELRKLAVESKWSSAADRTLSVAMSLYAHLPEGTPLWNGPGEIANAPSAALIEILQSAYR